MTCKTCRGEKRLCVGVSFPPKKTIAVKCEYEPCPDCTKGPHSGYAIRKAQSLRDLRERREAQP